MLQKEITVLPPPTPLSDPAASFMLLAASTHIAVWKKNNKKKPKTTCVRSFTSTPWWSSDPRLVAELVSLVFAWLRLERRSPARFTGGGERRRGRRRRKWMRWDLDWLPNTKTLGVSVLLRLNNLTTLSCSTIHSKTKRKKKRTVPSRTLHPCPPHSWKSMSSVLKLYLYVLYIHVTVLWLRHGFCRKNNTNKKKRKASRVLNK